MREIRLFEEGLQCEELGSPLEFQLSSENVHILSNVLRIKDGGEVTVINGRGQLARGIAKKNGKKWAIEIKDFRTVKRPDWGINLILSPPKGEAFDHIVRQAVEWGVAKFKFLKTEFSVRKLTEKTLLRAQKQAIEAIRQSENLFLPEFVEIQWSDLGSASPGIRILCDEREEETSLKNVLLSSQGRTKVDLAIGPEGGWSDKDRERFCGYGFLPAGLTSNVLKSDTAAVSAIAVVQTIFADGDSIP